MIKKNQLNKITPKTIIDFFNRNILSIENKKIGICVSGGVDSIVLLHLFNRLKEKYDLDIYVLHYNHKWRTDSYLDAELVKKYCNKEKNIFVYKEAKGSIVKSEEKARLERYKFFQYCAVKYALDIVSTAHHMDDQVETIIFRLARGTGPRGILPVKEISGLTKKTILERPLINIPKEYLIAFARKENLKFIQDETNLDLRYKRNLIRQKIVPVLSKINNKADTNMILFSKLVYAQNILLDRYFSHLLKRLSSQSAFTWRKDKFLKLDRYVQDTFLYWFLDKYKIPGSLNNRQNIKNIIAGNKSLDLNKEYRIVADKNNICFLRKQSLKQKDNKKEFKIEFSLNGNADKIPLSKESFCISPFNKKYLKGDFPQDSKRLAYVDLSNFIHKKLTVRNRQQHDVFKPLGFLSEVKLKKYLINKKVPRFKRNVLPLLCFKNEVLWIPGYSLSEKIKVKTRPTHMLKLVQRK